MAPDDFWPGWICFGSADDVDVHLADDVSDVADIEFGWGEVLLDELANCECGVVDVLVLGGGKVGDFGFGF